ncbi:MAG TPA: hypothetical protein H9716_13350, partial [Candidatus Enterocloster faecavium]|nr:hypothetical protein [Candidatus Enterocloster faecavium]
MVLGQRERNEMQEWFWLPKNEVLSELRTGEEGLDAREAKVRLREYGENV